MSTNIDMVDCSQPLHFSTHVKEKASEASTKHAEWVWGGGGVPHYSTRATIEGAVNSLLIWWFICIFSADRS